jgi:hypothetical protein
MTRTAAAALLSFSLLLLTAAPASAWSNKEHIQLARIAATRLIADPATPEPMRQWLKAAVPNAPDMNGERDYFLYKRIGIVARDVEGIPFWATMPDMEALTDQSKVEPFGVNERLLHFLDVEYFMPDEAKRVYHHDLSGKPKLSDFPDDPKDWRYARAGMLPFRVRDSYQKLVEAIRTGRLNDAPGKYPRDEHAAKWAGYLAHYAADNTQPHHATIDYKSQTYFADKRNAPNVHAEMEYRMCDDDNDDHMELRKEFWPLFVKALEEVKDPVQTDDPWRATLEVSLASYDALPLIGLAAMAAARQGGTPDAPAGRAERFSTEVFFRFKGSYGGRVTTVMEMKARQTAWAVKRIERLWLQAWNEAHK